MSVNKIRKTTNKGKEKKIWSSGHIELILVDLKAEGNLS
jgi:hypothetical protein